VILVKGFTIRLENFQKCFQAFVRMAPSAVDRDGFCSRPEVIGTNFQMPIRLLVELNEFIKEGLYGYLNLLALGVMFVHSRTVRDEVRSGVAECDRRLPAYRADGSHNLFEGDVSTPDGGLRRV